MNLLHLYKYIKAAMTPHHEYPTYSDIFGIMVFA